MRIATVKKVHLKFSTVPAVLDKPFFERGGCAIVFPMV
jgi:hypothetical protein